MKKLIFIICVLMCGCCDVQQKQYDVHNQMLKNDVSNRGIKWINKVDIEIDETIRKHSNNKTIYYYIGWNINVDTNMDAVHIVNYVINKFENAGYRMMRFISQDEYIFERVEEKSMYSY